MATRPRDTSRDSDESRVLACPPASPNLPGEKPAHAPGCPCGNPAHLSVDNPFGEDLARHAAALDSWQLRDTLAEVETQLGDLSQFGGQHAAPATDRQSPRQEQRVDHARETAEALSEEAPPF
ncbi:hypothetical protein [Botrimarina sp.]|uniref:hypothetical protein n=1 Tax=Botrimarina sp. TaxID=2795802 RepID=UPI0032ED9C10